MKRFLLLGLALLLLGSAAFADDAKVMPLRTGRLSLAPSFTTGEKVFTDDGTRETKYAIKAFNFGAALEYGITGWITGAVQWAPGVNAWSDVDTQVPYIDMSGGTPAMAFSTSTVRALDVGDLFVGAKMQILGKDAPIKNNKVRLAFAPGIKIPFGGPKFDKQAENAANGDKVTAGTMDNHVLALGLRSYFDFIINDKFFINFYNEALFNVTKRDFKKMGYMEYVVSQGMDFANTFLSDTFSYGKTKFGYELTFELEPVFSTPIGPVLFTASMPVTYKTAPGAKYDVSYDPAKLAMIMGALAADPGAQFAVGMVQSFVDDYSDQDPQSHSLSINPGIAVMFYKWKVPFEFEFNYKAPIWGMNSSANHTFVFIAKMFFKF